MSKENENDEKIGNSTSKEDDMTDHIKSYPWQHTPLGSISSWDENLINLTKLVDVISQPAFVLVGPELNLIYNKPLIDYLGPKHPNALGMSFFTVFPGFKESLSISFNKVVNGEKVLVEALMLPGQAGEDSCADLSLIPIFNHKHVEWIIGLITPVDHHTDENFLNILKQKGPGIEEELIALKELHLMTSKVLQAETLSEALHLILNAMIRILKADFGSIQLVIEHSKGPEIVAQVGFDDGFPKAFQIKDVHECSASSRALKCSQRVVIEDVNTDEAYLPLLSYALLAGYQSEQASPLINSKGKTIGVLSTHYKEPKVLDERSLMLLDIMTLQITDIIEHFQREEKVRLSKELELEHSKIENKQKDEFIDIAGHELKAPLTSLSAYLQILQDKDFTLDDETATRYLQKTENSVHRLSKLITHLLEMSRIKSGNIRYHFDRLDILEMILESIEHAKFESSIHKLTLLENVSCIIVGDKDRLQQVMDNYLSNAIKYSPHGGEILVSIKQMDGKVEIAVKDEGLGVPENMLQEIFKPYYRVDSEGKNRISGLGLGLYISSEIIKDHNGKCWAESTPGAGSVFYFSIPAHANRDDVG